VFYNKRGYGGHVDSWRIFIKSQQHLHRIVPPPQPFCSDSFFTSIPTAIEESQESITNRLQEIRKLLIFQSTSFRCHILYWKS
jgi:hypothetical protein